MKKLVYVLFLYSLDYCAFIVGCHLKHSVAFKRYCKFILE